MRVTLFVALALFVISCGKNQQAENSPANGASEPANAFRFKADPVITSNCAGRGYHLQLWQDKNQNTTYEAAVDGGFAEDFFCVAKPEDTTAAPPELRNLKLNGEQGAALAYRAAPVAATECPISGIKVEFFNATSVAQPPGDKDRVFGFTQCDATPPPKDGEDGKDGEAGKDGANGTNGFSAVVLVAKFKHSAQCGTSGSTVRSFTDVNGNGAYDPGIDLAYSEMIVCDGHDGLSKGVAVEKLEHHADCEANASVVKTWSDVNRNGVFDAAIDKDYSESIVCDGKNFQSPFIATYWSTKQTIRFDLNRYTQFDEVKRGARAGIYGEFTNYVTGTKNVLVFEPKYFECTENGQTKTLDTLEFFELLNSVVQGQIFEKQKAKDAIQAELDAHTAKKAQTDKFLSETEAKIKAAQTGVSQTRVTIQDYTDRLKGISALMQEKQTNGASLRQEIQLTKHALAKAEAKVQTLGMVKEQTHVMLAEAKAKAVVQQSEILALRTQLGVQQPLFDKEKQTLRRLSSEVLAVSKVIADLEVAIAKGDFFGSKTRRLKKEKDKLVSLISHKNLSEKEALSLEAKVSALTTGISDQEKENKALALSIQKTEAGLADTAQKLADAQQLQKKLAALVASLSASHDSLTVYLGDLKKSAAEVTQRRAQASTLLADLLSEETKLIALSQELGQVGADLKTKIEDETKAVDTMKARIAHLLPIPKQHIASKTFSYRFDSAQALFLVDGNKTEAKLDRNDADPLPKSDVACQDYVTSLLN